MMIPKQKLPSLASAQSGFTLIECLLAIVIVGVMMVAVAPALVLSAATRVQARRVEMATQAAQTYVDNLRAEKIPPPPYGIVLTQDLNSPNQKLLNGYPAPQGASSWSCQLTPLAAGATPTAANFYCKDAANKPELYCVDFDRDAGCTKGDYLVQGFRSFYPDTSDDGTRGYLLGIRVYRADAMTINGRLQTTVARGGKRVATHTGGVGDRTAPLVEMTTEIRTKQTTYDSLKQRLGVQPSTSTNGSSSTTTP
jgi:prepilin-type N-terminal cleavage/methylation domain-containing protein